MITLFYTHRLHGDLEFAPRLFTMLKSLRTAAGDGAILYVDLGESCAREIWHCAVTGGRSALFALDAMGCDAANAEAIHPQNRAKVQETVAMRLIARGDSQVIKGMRFLTSPSVPQPKYEFEDSLPQGEGQGVRAIRAVSLTPATQTFAHGGILYLAGLEAAQIGVVQIADGTLADAAIQDVPADTPPDPTIMGAVEFILGEAHYILKKAQGRG